MFPDAGSFLRSQHNRDQSDYQLATCFLTGLAPFKEYGCAISPTGSCFDVTIVLGEPDLLDEHRDRLLNPTVIFEVLSPSTESYDRGPKFAHYRTMQSLQEFILVSQTELRVERYLRQADGNWLYSEITDPAGSLELTSVVCRVPLSRIYRKVDFERAKRRA
jgi:Uma2 family endonuclease